MLLQILPINGGLAAQAIKCQTILKMFLKPIKYICSLHSIYSFVSHDRDYYIILVNHSTIKSR